MVRARLRRLIERTPPCMVSGIDAALKMGDFMPSRTRLDEFIAVVESGDHAGAIERYYTEDASMQENAAPPRVGRDVLVAHERGVLARMAHVYSKAVSSTVEGDRVAIHWIFELTDKSGKVHRIDEVALQQWRGDRISRERFFYDPSKPKT
jgi:ketosteroid isomerase-like protein